MITTDAGRVRRPDGDPAPPEFLVLGYQDDYDEPRRGIVEAVTVADDAMVLEIAMTASEGPYLHLLNRLIGPVLTKYSAQKTNLLVFTWEEAGWLAG